MAYNHKYNISTYNIFECKKGGIYMINARVDQNSKTVYVDVSGYITNEEANSFLAKQRHFTDMHQILDTNF